MVGARDAKKGERQRVTITIAGEHYVLLGHATQQYMEQLAREVHDKFVKLQETFPNVPRHRLAMLTAINLADEVHKLREENRELLELLEETS